MKKKTNKFWIRNTGTITTTTIATPTTIEQNKDEKKQNKKWRRIVRYILNTTIKKQYNKKSTRARKR